MIQPSVGVLLLDGETDTVELLSEVPPSLGDSTPNFARLAETYKINIKTVIEQDSSMKPVTKVLSLIQ